MGLGSALKKVAKAAVKVAGGIAGVATGGIGGLAVSAVSSLVAKQGGSSPSTAIRVDRPGVIDLPGGFGINLPFAGPSGYGMIGSGSRRGRVQAGPHGECPKGYHLNKSKTVDGMPARSFCVRNRHVNFANGRAARRAGRRLKGTVRVLRRSFTLVAAKAPKGKWIPKGRK